MSYRRARCIDRAHGHTILSLCVLALGACGGTQTAGPTQSSGEAVGAPIDFQLDCTNDDGWSFEGALDPAATGDADTARDAFEEYVGRLRPPGATVRISVLDARASLVVDDRELAVMAAAEAPAGGWMVISVVACSDVPEPPLR